MALLNTNKNYIKLQINSFIIYKNKTARNNEKNAEKKYLYDAIRNKYCELINNYDNTIINFADNHKIPHYLNDEQLDYYLNLYPKLGQLISDKMNIVNEQYDFINDLNIKHGKQHQYPIMKQYYPEIDKIIPDIICSGYVKLQGSDVHELYEDAKNKKIFGDTTDC